MSCSHEVTRISVGSVFSSTWDFNKSSSYEYDSNYVEVINGQAKLKSVNLKNENYDFSNGKLIGVNNDSNQLKLSSDNSFINKILPGRISDIVWYWPFDSSANARVGVDGNTESNGTGLNFKVGYINEALMFDGVDDRVSFIAPNLPKITYASWVRLDSFTNLFPRVLSLFNQSRDIWVEGLAGEERLVFRFKASGTFGEWETPNGSIKLGKWQHIAVSYDASSIINVPKIYINGVLQTLTQIKVPIGVPDITAGISAVGNRLVGGYDRPWGGMIDEAILFSSIIEANDILKIYNAQKFSFSNDSSLHPSWAPKWPSMVGYWKMDGNWQDSSVVGNHGTPFFDVNLMSPPKK